MKKWVFSIFTVLICLIVGSLGLVLLKIDFQHLGILWKVILFGAYFSVGKAVFEYFKKQEKNVDEG